MLYTGLFFAGLLISGFLLFKLNVLTKSGVVATVLFAGALYFAGGFLWLVPALTFLILASIWTRWPGKTSAKKAARNGWQVLANGTVPILGSILTIYATLTQQHQLAGIGLKIMLGGFAAAAADTWATEWGKTFGGRPLDLRSFRRVDAGNSGAVSVVGLIASIAGAASIAVSASATGLITVSDLFPVMIAGFLGSVTDSIAGATLQAVWLDKSGKPTELRSEAQAPNSTIQGWKLIDNDTVNLICTLMGGLLAIFLL